MGKRFTDDILMTLKMEKNTLYNTHRLCSNLRSKPFFFRTPQKEYIPFDSLISAKFRTSSCSKQDLGNNTPLSFEDIKFRGNLFQQQLTSNNANLHVAGLTCCGCLYHTIYPKDAVP